MCFAAPAIEEWTERGLYLSRFRPLTTEAPFCSGLCRCSPRSPPRPAHKGGHFPFLATVDRQMRMASATEADEPRSIVRGTPSSHRPHLCPRFLRWQHAPRPFFFFKQKTAYEI